jgi:flagellar hook-basal body complex protein FliE
MVRGVGSGGAVWTGLEALESARNSGAAGKAGAVRNGGAGGIEGGLEGGEAVQSGTDFGNVLTQAVQSVEQTQANADGALYRVATGQDADLHGMITALEEANISLRTMASVRDKVVEAYQAIWNMPV